MTKSNDRGFSANAERIVIKKYPNRRLYDTKASTYVTLDDLAQMVREDRDFVVCDSKTGSDLTHSVLTQIIFEQQSKAGGPMLLPIPFLRQLIRYYDDAVGKMVPGYLQMSMAALAQQHERYRMQLSTWGPNTFEVYQEQVRQNLAMFENALALWTSHAHAEINGADLSQGVYATRAEGDTPALDCEGSSQDRDSQDDRIKRYINNSTQKRSADAADASQRNRLSEIDDLKAQLATMQKKIDEISRLE